MLLLLSILLMSSLPAVLSDTIATLDTRDDLIANHIELVRDTGDESHILSRSRRSADDSEVCKYAKGDWSECDRMIMVSYMESRVSCFTQKLNKYSKNEIC